MNGKTLTILLSVAFGVAAIFKMVPDLEVAIGFLTISFGILAIIWTAMSVGALSKGSSLRKHTVYFLISLISILLFSIWHTLSKILGWRQTIVEAWMYPGYLFLAASFIIFVFTAYQVLQMGHQFGFSGQARKIQKVMASKSKKAAQ
ncbi:MAG TPA: hypothetical protein VJH97_03660 [Candidatus Nanoarchaeia archaeon]|nr:hypothetical protein [Candidatus Nanoarchaeia archaeon]